MLNNARFGLVALAMVALSGCAVKDGWQGAAAEKAYDKELEIKRLAERITTVPGNFKVHPLVEKVLADRAAMGRGEINVDWGMGEHLAFAIGHHTVHLCSQRNSGFTQADIGLLFTGGLGHIKAQCKRANGRQIRVFGHRRMGIKGE